MKLIYSLEKSITGSLRAPRLYCNGGMMSEGMGKSLDDLVFGADVDHAEVLLQLDQEGHERFDLWRVMLFCTLSMHLCLFLKN